MVGWVGDHSRAMGSPGPPMRRSRRQSKCPCRPRPGVRWRCSLVGWRGAAVLPVPSGPQPHQGALRDHSQQAMTLTAATPWASRGSPNSTVPQVPGWLAENCPCPGWPCPWGDALAERGGGQKSTVLGPVPPVGPGQ